MVWMTDSETTRATCDVLTCSDASRQDRQIDFAQMRASCERHKIVAKTTPDCGNRCRPQISGALFGQSASISPRPVGHPEAGTLSRKALRRGQASGGVFHGFRSLRVWETDIPSPAVMDSLSANCGVQPV